MKKGVKKRFCTILFLSFAVSCMCQNLDKGKYLPYYIEVAEIDSTKDYYIIYATEQSTNERLKIVVRKIGGRRNIYIGTKFHVSLYNLIQHSPILTDIDMPCDWHYGFPNGNVILNEPDCGCNLFYAKEIFGLYYTHSQSEIEQYHEWIRKHPLPWNQVRGEHVDFGTLLPCIEEEQISSSNCMIRSNTDSLLLVMPTPQKVPYNRQETFVCSDTIDNQVTGYQKNNLFWFKDIAYQDRKGLASVYWMSFKHNLYTISINGIEMNHSFTLDDFDKLFCYKEENVFFLNGKRQLVSRKDSHVRYTCIGLPICNSSCGEHIIFFFDKNKHLSSLIFNLIT